MKASRFTSILDSPVKALVKDLESRKDLSAIQRDLKLQELIAILKQNCEKDEIKQRYQNYKGNGGSAEIDFKEIGYYPVDPLGFAQSFDPLQDEEAFWNCWYKYGIIVTKNAVSSILCKNTINRIQQIV